MVTPQSDTEQGFSLTEVLVAILITTIFIATAMQAIVFAAVFRVKARQNSQAINWIQQDLENVRSLASSYEISATPYSAKCSASDSVNGIAAGFITDSSGLGGSNFINTSPPYPIPGGSFVLNRNATYSSSVDPYKIVQLNYSVVPQGGGTPLAVLNTEVIPDAAFKCP